MRSRLTRIVQILALAAPLSWLGCGDSAGDDPDAALDGALSDAGGDAAPDGGAGDPCDAPLTDTVFELDPDGPDTQLHVAAAFDGEAVWVVYSRPDARGYFDVYGMRLGCDGTAVLPPFQINTTDENDLDPALAVADGNVYVTWMSDNNTGVDNMDILVRTFAVDGTPLMAADQILETTYDGTPVVGNAMSPDIAALPNGQFVVAGMRGLDVAPDFQVFAQRLDSAGLLVGGAVDPSIEPTMGQRYPAVSATPDGAIYLAYTRSATTLDEWVYHTRYAPGATTPDASPVAAVTGRVGTGAAYASSPDGTRVYLAFGDGDAVVLTDGAIFGAAPLVELNTGSSQDHSPSIATRDGGGAVAWLRHMSGLNNELHARAFTYDGASFQLSADQVVNAEYVPPIYGTTITHVRDNVYFLAWSEGANPDFRIKGKFMVIE